MIIVVFRNFCLKTFEAFSISTNHKSRASCVQAYSPHCIDDFPNVQTMSKPNIVLCKPISAVCNFFFNICKPRNSEMVFPNVSEILKCFAKPCWFAAYVDVLISCRSFLVQSGKFTFGEGQKEFTQVYTVYTDLPPVGPPMDVWRGRLITGSVTVREQSWEHQESLKVAADEGQRSFSARPTNQWHWQSKIAFSWRVCGARSLW